MDACLFGGEIDAYRPILHQIRGNLERGIRNARDYDIAQRKDLLELHARFLDDLVPSITNSLPAREHMNPFQSDRVDTGAVIR